MKKPENLDPSDKMEEFLKDEETLATDHYDEDGDGNCTIGYGHLIHFGECGSKPEDPEWQKYKDGLDDETEAQKLLDQDMKEHSGYVEDYIDVKLTQYEFDALSSLIFNAGSDNFRKSSVSTAINNNKSLSTIQKEIESFAISAPGHPDRRKREAAMYGGNL